MHIETMEEMIDYVEAWVAKLSQKKSIFHPFFFSSGRECRHPYLDEELVRFSLSVPLHLLVSFDLECGNDRKK